MKKQDLITLFLYTVLGYLNLYFAYRMYGMEYLTYNRNGEKR